VAAGEKGVVCCKRNCLGFFERQVFLMGIYKKPTMKVIKMENVDVLTTSGCKVCNDGMTACDPGKGLNYLGTPADGCQSTCSHHQ
jgi:hypothetical protein